MILDGPSLIVGLYQVRPNQRTQWFDTWRHLAAIARSNPDCRTFHLDSDPDDGNKCRIITTWSNDAAFDCFVRDVGLAWIERYLDYSELPAHFSRFRLAHREVERPTAHQFVHA